MELHRSNTYAREYERSNPISSYKLLDVMHFSLENSFLDFMKTTQQTISSITNKLREVEHEQQRIVSHLSMLLNISQDWLNTDRDICHTGMAVVLEAKRRWFLYR